MDSIINSFWTSQDLIYIWFVWIIAFFWIRTVLWITKDINARSNNWFLQAISIIIWIVPILWYFIYLLIRPIWYKYDKLSPWREVLSIQSIQCPDCWQHNMLTYNFCTNCWEKLQNECKECKIKYSVEFEFCPNCSAPNIDVK